MNGTKFNEIYDELIGMKYLEGVFDGGNLEEIESLSIINLDTYSESFKEYFEKPDKEIKVYAQLLIDEKLESRSIEGKIAELTKKLKPDFEAKSNINDIVRRMNEFWDEFEANRKHTEYGRAEELEKNGYQILSQAENKSSRLGSIMAKFKVELNNIADHYVDKNNGYIRTIETWFKGMKVSGYITEDEYNAIIPPDK